jgi:hypothetical protein
MAHINLNLFYAANCTIERIASLTIIKGSAISQNQKRFDSGQSAARLGEQ